MHGVVTQDVVVTTGVVVFVLQIPHKTGQYVCIGVPTHCEGEKLLHIVGSLSHSNVSQNKPF